VSLAALLLVLVAAAMHTGWNFVVKQVADKHVFTWWALVVGALVYLPLPVRDLPIPARIWPYAMVGVWRAHWKGIIGVGILMLLTYMLVLQAYAAARVSYVGAVREASIVFAALAGWLWLREGFGVVRTTGAALIFGGMLIIALAGE
jgi:drug/metabolite transporter (DMT)-like permease